jgi:hypothetical protein
MRKWTTEYTKWHVVAMDTDAGKRRIGSLVQNKGKAATKITIYAFSQTGLRKSGPCGQFEAGVEACNLPP